jgi:hypothetical protein
MRWTSMPMPAPDKAASKIEGFKGVAMPLGQFRGFRMHGDTMIAPHQFRNVRPIADISLAP